jgi:O-antigen/teichoic acid export membrane protein
LRAIYRDLLKHSSIYGVGQILSRITSFLLLPLYTSYLRPQDYGRIAILDVTATVMGILIAGGMVQAVNRHHFEAHDDDERDGVWWSGLTFVVLTSTVLILPAWLFRNELARWTLGPDERGGYYYSLVLPTLFLTMVGELPSAYLRTHKRSGLYVALSLGKLLVSICLNILFLVGLGWGVAGVLTGNLIAQAAMALCLFTVFASSRRHYAFHWPLIRRLVFFASPLVFTALLSITMQQANRYMFGDLYKVGIYSLAAQIGQGANTFFIIPFAQIWGVSIYEIAKQPNAKFVFVNVFKHFICGLMLALFGVSLFAKPVLKVMAASDYEGAAALVPIVCLGYVFYSMHDHFRVPVMLSKRTTSLMPTFLIAAPLSVVLNLCLIPLFGMAGAAWANVLAFAAFSFTGLAIYRRIDRFDYPLLRCGLVLCGMVLSVILCRALEQFLDSSALSLAVNAIVWLAWAIFLFGKYVYGFLASGRLIPHSSELTIATPQPAQTP